MSSGFRLRIEGGFWPNTRVDAGFDPPKGVAMSVPVESVAVGRCFLTALGQIRRVTETGAGTVTYLVLGKTVLGGDERTTSKQRFARDVERELLEQEVRMR